MPCVYNFTGIAAISDMPPTFPAPLWHRRQLTLSRLHGLEWTFPTSTVAWSFVRPPPRIASRGFYTMGEASRDEALHAIDWVQGKSTGALTTSCEIALRHQQMGPRAIWLHGLARDRVLLNEGKHAFWQLTSRSTCVSGICHQSYQWLIVRIQGVIARANGGRDAYDVKELPRRLGRGHGKWLELEVTVPLHKHSFNDYSQNDTKSLHYWIHYITRPLNIWVYCYHAI